MKIVAPVSELFLRTRIETDDPDLIRQQVQAVERQLPWMYFILCLNAAALGFTHYGTAPDYLTLWTVGGLILFCAGRAGFWYLSPRAPYDHQAGVRKLRTLWIFGTLLTLAFNAWAIMLLPYGDPYQQGHVEFFMCITVVGCVFAVIQFPAVAFTLLAITALSVLVFFSLSGNVTQIAMAINFAIVAVIIVLINQILFRSFHDQIRSRRALKSEKKKVEQLNAELIYHQDNLEQEISRRTEEIREQAIRLEQALDAERKLNKLQSEFVSMVSHEFRTPLTIIDGTARRLERTFHQVTPVEAQERLTRIRSSVSRLSGLIERTLDASKLANGRIKIEPCRYDLKALIQDAVERQLEFNADFDFRLSLDGLPQTFLGDVRLMDNVFTNLISNAIKYSGASRHIDISAHMQGETAVIAVKDYGIGIAEAELPFITTRFYRASSATGIQGTGIGLNLVKSLVEQHGGQLEITSQEGAWTEVILHLPVRPGFEADLPESSADDRANMDPFTGAFHTPMAS